MTTFTYKNWPGDPWQPGNGSWKIGVERRLNELARDQRWSWTLVIGGFVATLTALAAGYMELDRALDRRFDRLQEQLVSIVERLPIGERQ